MSAAMRFDRAARTHAGCLRETNEDAFVDRTEDGFWAVADGMGGHAGGQWASATLADALRGKKLGDARTMSEQALDDALRHANEAIRAAGEQTGQVRGSTIAGLLIRDHRYSIMWAGDSRIYLLRDGALTALTTDHSQIQHFIDHGLLSEREAVDHPLGHILTRAVGVRDELDLDWRIGNVFPGDVFLLCSDGLTRTVKPDEMASALASKRPQDAADHLLQTALARGAPDNVTLVIVGCEPTTLMQLQASHAAPG